MRTVEEITQDLKDCYSCESKECLFPIPTICGKPQDASVIAYEAEMGKAIINLFGIGRLEEICNAEREGRCRGKWEVIGMRPAGTSQTHYCSICENHGSGDMRFCPSCGARMEVED